MYTTLDFRCPLKKPGLPEMRQSQRIRIALWLCTTVVAGVEGKLDPLTAGRSRVESSIFAESALIDKETGRIFWESGGSGSTLSKAVLGKFGLGQHAKAIVLSLLLFLGLLGQASVLCTNMPRNRLLFYAAVLLKYVCFLAPKFNNWFLLVLVVLYFWEATNCETYQYLSNMMESHEEIERHIEMLRQQPPVVTWKVRSFHFERSIWHHPGLLCKLVVDMMGMRRSQYQRIRQDNNIRAIGEDDFDMKRFTFWPISRKKVTNLSNGSYRFKHWADNTMVGLWQRAKSSFSFPKSHFFHGEAPFAKLSLTKLLVLSDETARKEYFSQQSNFLTEHSVEDDLAEFSTSINVEGFKPRVLAVRPFGKFGGGNQKISLLLRFWLLTAIGVTVPFRIWFCNQCDEIRVSVVKESFAKAPSSSVTHSNSESYRSWWQWSGLTFKRKDEEKSTEPFRQTMRQLALYKQEENQNDENGFIVPVKKALKQITQKMSKEDHSDEPVLLKHLNASEIVVLEEMREAIETAEMLASNLTSPNETVAVKDGDDSDVAPREDDTVDD